MSIIENTTTVDESSQITQPEGTRSEGTGPESAPVEPSAIADGLSRLLADTYTLGLKTQNYHWNVVGPMFTSLHLLFEEQYTELSSATDLIAERIRALDVPAPGTSREFATLTVLDEDHDRPDAVTMVERLLGDHLAVARTARSALALAGAAGDASTADLLTRRIDGHERAAWMLRSLLA